MLDGVTNILDLGTENEVVLLPCSIGHHAFLQSFYYVCVLWKNNRIWGWVVNGRNLISVWSISLMWHLIMDVLHKHLSLVLSCLKFSDVVVHPKMTILSFTHPRRSQHFCSSSKNKWRFFLRKPRIFCASIESQFHQNLAVIIYSFSYRSRLIRLTFVLETQMKIFLMKPEIFVPPLKAHSLKPLILQKVHTTLFPLKHKCIFFYTEAQTCLLMCKNLKMLQKDHKDIITTSNMVNKNSNMLVDTWEQLRLSSKYSWAFVYQLYIDQCLYMNKSLL